MQSSVTLLEKQRGPGVGYWASRNESTSDMRSPTSSVSDLKETSSSRPSSPSTVKSDEEVNFEYLRNVIMQFLEHKEMRVSRLDSTTAVTTNLTDILASLDTHLIHHSAVHSPGDSATHIKSIITCSCFVAYIPKVGHSASRGLYQCISLYIWMYLSRLQHYSRSGK